MVDDLGKQCVVALFQWFHKWLLQFNLLLLLGGLDFLTFFFMLPLDVSIDGGRCLLTRSIVKLVYVENYPFLVS